MPTSKTHLVLVVHGIGEQISGDTVGAVVAGATGKHVPRAGDDLREVNVEVSSARLRLLEDLNALSPNDEAAQQDLEKSVSPLSKTSVDVSGQSLTELPSNVFECQIYTLHPASDPQRKTIFAEVHWSDLSPAPKGAIATILDLLSLILGLGYLAMDNAENTKTSGIGRWFHPGVVHFFNWVFYGGIAAVNAMMLIGTILLFGAQFLPAGLLGASGLPVGLFVTNAVLAGTALAGFGLWLWICMVGRRSQRFLVTVFRRGVFAWSVLVSLTFLGIFANPEMMKPILHWVFQLIPDGISAQSFGCSAFFQGSGVPLSDLADKRLACFVEFNLLAIGLAWMLAAVLVVVMISGSANDDKRVIYPAICGGMLMLWSVFTSGFWIAVRQLLDRSDATFDKCQPSRLHEVQVTLGLVRPREIPSIYEVFCKHLDTALNTLAVSVGMLLVIALFAAYAVRHKRRLILNDNFRAALMLFPFALLASFFLPSATATWSPLAASIALGIALLVYNFSELVAPVLGIARDVIVYAVRAQCRITFRTADQRETNYPQRKRIEARFGVVFKQLYATYQPGKITVISHSQGTVIAARALSKLIPHFEKLESPDNVTGNDTEFGKRVRLITMGSPISNVYARYFPVNYDLTETAISPHLVWHNLYRTGDYVGQIVDTAGLPEGRNHCVGPGGHSHYFTDPRVWKIFRDKVGFRLFPRA